MELRRKIAVADWGNCDELTFNFLVDGKDWQVWENTARLYIPDEIVTFDTPEDLARKIAYYLEHEEERQAIALRGLYRTMMDHTYVSRLNQLLDLALSESPTHQEP